MSNDKEINEQKLIFSAYIVGSLHHLGLFSIELTFWRHGNALKRQTVKINYAAKRLATQSSSTAPSFSAFQS